MLTNIARIIVAHQRVKHAARQNGVVRMDNTDCRRSYVRAAKMVRRRALPVKYKLNGYEWCARRRNVGPTATNAK